jgi:uncharacterized caspase-like protein
MEKRGKYLTVNFLVFFIIVLYTFTTACQSKGVTVEKNEKVDSVGNIYAIIIGISDYKFIVPPLNYAHKDALIFYNYLVQHEKCNPNNIKLLINQEVNMGSIYDAVDSILTHIKQGDRLFFYFSGHGGVESSQSDDMAGMLFLTESPQNNFRRNKNFIYTLEDLKFLINSVNEKQATAIVIIDACHAGKFSFAGGKEGTHKILKTLQANWMNEIKFLACQEREEAIENSNYGNGRGVFSYYLTEGLQLINPKKDDRITLFDLDAFVSKKVREATGEKQTPIAVGDRNFVVITKPKQKLLPSVPVLENVVTSTPFQEDNQNQIPKKKTGNNAKPLSYRTSANASETNFQKYQAALKENRFFKPENDCAYFHYKEFIKDSTHNKDTQRKMINELTKVIEGKTDSLTNEFLDGKVGKITPQRVQNLLNDLESIQKEIKNKSSYESALYTKKYFLKSLMENDTSAIKSLQIALDYDYYSPYVLRSLTERYALTNQEDLALKYLLRYVDVLPNDSCARVSLRVINECLKSKEEIKALFSMGDITESKIRYLGFNVSKFDFLKANKVKNIDDFDSLYNTVNIAYKRSVIKSNRAEYEIIIEGGNEKFVNKYLIRIYSIDKRFTRQELRNNRIVLEFGKNYEFVIRAPNRQSNFFLLSPTLNDYNHNFKITRILEKNTIESIAIESLPASKSISKNNKNLIPSKPKYTTSQILERLERLKMLEKRIITKTPPAKSSLDVLTTAIQKADKPKNKGLALIIENNINEKDIPKTFENLGFDVIVRSNATYSETLEAINDFKNKLKNYEVALLYYLGNGITLKDKTYIVTTDFDSTLIKSGKIEEISFGNIISKMKESNVKTNLVIADVCQSSKSKKTVILENYNNVLQGLNKSDLQNNKQGFLTIESYSSEGKNGLLTRELLKNLEISNKSWADALYETTIDVKNISNNKETAHITNTLTKDFYLYDLIKINALQPKIK